jgi:nicotinate-nucleotide adenylyltransferase
VRRKAGTASMRIAILGGSFNPVHYGHLLLAQEAAFAFGYDRIVFIPAGNPPHKRIDLGADQGQRLAMVRLAIEGNPAFACDDREIARGGPSYTVETLEDFLLEGEIEGKPGLIIGDDLAEGFGGWRNPRRVAEISDIIVARRASEEAVDFPYPHKRLSNPVFPLSSSEIRDRIRMRMPWRYLLPDAVYRYIVENRLYGC